jgi:hypothetical protein
MALQADSTPGNGILPHRRAYEPPAISELGADRVAELDAEFRDALALRRSDEIPRLSVRDARTCWAARLAVCGAGQTPA